MKAYLHGGRAGQTFKVKDVQFVNGVSEVHKISNYLSKYYAVKDYPPSLTEEESAEMHEALMDSVEIIEEEKDGVQIKEGQEAEEVNPDIVEGIEELRKVVEEKKKQLNTKASLPVFENWFQYKSDVEKLTGIKVRGRAQAEEALAKYVEENNL